MLSLILFSFTACIAQDSQTEIRVGAERFSSYLDYLSDKRVAVVANQTSMAFSSHLVDTLLAMNVDVRHVFAPEHGFRGLADAGASISNTKDPKTGLKVYSLYGKNKKPNYLQLEDIDIVLFDLQDVGVRFYTYISTLHYMMEACAEFNVEVMVLDRPNPNGFYVDGPVLKEGYSSFVGLHPVSLVHGMTIGEYARMINGEAWLADGIECKLKVISCANYTHKDKYILPVNPSPNLPNMASIYLYPSLALFEGTIVSVGRGTDKAFQQYGHPRMQGPHSFTPKSRLGASAPKLEGEVCNGEDLSAFGEKEMPDLRALNLDWIISSYEQLKGEEFFLKNNFINLLWGSDRLQKMIKEGKTASEIASSWEEELQEFKETRSKYLLYEDFE